jgi:hypothetical protein
MTFDTNGPLIVTSESIWKSREVFAALIGVVGVVVGVLLTLFTEWVRGRYRRRAHWAALSAEIELCRNLAETYLKDEIGSPLYRLPTIAYANSLPVLLSDGSLNEDDTRKLLSFFNEVETLNRGLDQAEGARLISDPMVSDGKLIAEFRRNRLKAERLVPAMTNDPSYYDAAKSVVRSRLGKCAL